MDDTNTRTEQHDIPDQDLTPEQVSEIDLQKYLLSEQAGYDVGWEFAKQSWLEQQVPAAPVLAEAEELTSPDQPAPLPGMTESRPSHEEMGAQKPKGIGGFFKRLLSKAASF